ncbi:uncharacterized protein LOC142616431 [Castanea sativa]|uniref:uncharacterized protein LOC142616431 n=1 Tax=Castanea sativa TaxID=21020 RepID=UPI003F64DC8E
MATCKVSLKLLIDTKGNKVLFAEAGKDFVDFLFNILSLPLGNVINLLTKNSMVGSLGNVYESIETLSEAYLQPNQSKDAILKPETPASATSYPLFLSSTVKSVSVNKFYMCQYFHQNVADDPRVTCPQCQYLMSVNVPYISPAMAKEALSNDEGGYVKGVVTYVVMDDLVVKPMSTTSIITLLQKFNVKEIGALEERVVHLGMDEVCYGSF